MGMNFVIYGYIATHGWTYAPYGVGLSHLMRANRKAIALLPPHRDEDRYPFLTQGIFSASRAIYGDTHLIHFGASYKDLDDYVWADWVHKFEWLLRRMFWNEAEAQVTGVSLNDCCTWHANPPLARGGKLYSVRSWMTDNNPVERSLDEFSTAYEHLETVAPDIPPPPLPEVSIRINRPVTGKDDTPGKRRW